MIAAGDSLNAYGNWELYSLTLSHLFFLQGNLIGRAVIEYCDCGPPVS